MGKVIHPYAKREIHMSDFDMSISKLQREDNQMVALRLALQELADRAMEFHPSGQRTPLHRAASLGYR